MKYITKKDQEDLIPNSIDVKLAESKGLAQSGQLSDNYFVLQSVYYSLLEQYIETYINIKAIEDSFREKNIRQVPEEEKDIYQYLSSNNYFYIRNTLYVEKLPKEVILKLLSELPEKATPELLDMIKSTYKEVVRTDDMNVETFDISYGPETPSYSASNEALVLGYRNAEEDEDLYEDEDAWFEDFTNRRKYITDSLKDIQAYLTNKLGNCAVIEYFEESVKKKNNSQIVK